jgi:hypothetical protein
MNENVIEQENGVQPADRRAIGQVLQDDNNMMSLVVSRRFCTRLACAGCALVAAGTHAFGGT